MEKVYLVIGTIWETGSLEAYDHTVVSEYAVHSTREGAQAELQRILDETTAEAEKNGTSFQHFMKDNGLIIIWDDYCSEEHWDLLVRTVDNKD